MADVRVHDDVAHAVDDAGVHQHEPISLEVDARFGAQLDHRGDLPRERPAEREAESGCELPRWGRRRAALELQCLGARNAGSCNGFSSSPLNTNVNA